ncbi:hypothetical protein AAC387_Pa01g0098 [Persea americana]
MATRPVHTINVMEHCRVSPPAGSVAETSLPLTFFDLIWLRVNVVVRSVSFFELFMAACEAISGAIQRFDDDDGVLGRSDGWFRRLLSIMEAGERIISVAGSPRLGFYDMDFGSGRPSKVVVTSIEQRGGISLAESRDDAGRGLEVGVALPKHEMEQFTYYYDKGLKNY